MNFNNSASVPFTISNVNHGLQKAEGLLKLSEKGLMLEFKLLDAFIGMIQSDVQTALVYYKDLESITFEKGWLSSNIVLEGISMEAFKTVPGTEVATCTLKIKRKDKNEASSLVSKARMLLSEYRLEQMDDGN